MFFNVLVPQQTKKNQQLIKSLLDIKKIAKKPKCDGIWYKSSTKVRKKWYNVCKQEKCTYNGLNTITNRKFVKIFLIMCIWMDVHFIMGNSYLKLLNSMISCYKFKMMTWKHK
jgi:hypothetical protein